MPAIPKHISGSSRYDRARYACVGVTRQTLIAIEHVLADVLGRPPDQPVFHKGVYFGLYEIVMDVIGVALIVGCAMFLYRRWRGVGSFARGPVDAVLLLLLIVIGVSGYLLEGLRIIHAQTPLPGLSPIGYLFARAFGAPVPGVVDGATVGGTVGVLDVGEDVGGVVGV